MSKITDKELEELEREFEEALKPKAKANKVIDVNKWNADIDKDLEELNKREEKINKTFEVNNYDDKIVGKLEKHLSKESPNIVFYDKLKYRKNNVIGINFKSDKYENKYYSRNKIEKIANDLSEFLHEEGVRGIMSNALLYPSDWKSGLFTEIGEDVILADLKKYLDFYEEPKEYKQFQLYLVLKPKAEGGNDKFNDCLYNCLHLYLYNRLPWRKPEELKKYLKLKRNDKIPITCINTIENKLKTYQINVRGDYIYSSTLKSNKVINLILSDEHYTIDREVDNCKIKNISYCRKTILLYDRKNSEVYDGIEKRIIKSNEIDYKLSSKYVVVKREEYFKTIKENGIKVKMPVSIEEEYKEYIEASDELYKASNGVIDLRKTGSIKNTALNLFDKFTKFLSNPDKIEQDESIWISECNSGALMYAEKYEGQAYKYDVKSMYPSLLKSTLKIPIQRGEFNILSHDEFNKMEYFQLGIYRIKIEKSEDENINKLFRFNKYNKYTHTSLEHAKSLNLKMTLIQDETANFLCYSVEKRIGCNELFGEYIDFMFDLKEKKISKAKYILNVLWGSLCEIEKRTLMYKNKEIRIGEDYDIYSIKPNEKNENHLEIITTKQSKFYKTGFARLSPFLISQGRYHMSKILYPHRENVKQCHTDGFVSDKALDIKTGDKMGDLVGEGKCEHCIINHVNSVEGEFN